MAKNKKPSPARKPAKPISKPKPSAKPAARKHTVPAPKPVPSKPAAAGSAKTAKPSAKGSARADLRSKLLSHKGAKPIAFSLDEVRAIAKTNTGKSAPDKPAKAAPAAKSAAGVKNGELAAKAAKPVHVKAASLSDILGFNPLKARKHITLEEREVPEKFVRYYRLLIDLRNHVLEGLNQRTEETLKRSSKDDSGDLSGYGQHMADAGTDTFDRDFALSLVSSEQEAIAEIDAAIKRIHDGTYGICELTGKPIARDRLLAVPFTRFSAEAQKEREKNNYRASQRGGIFSDLGGEEGGKIPDENSADE